MFSLICNKKKIYVNENNTKQISCLIVIGKPKKSHKYIHILEWTQYMYQWEFIWLRYHHFCYLICTKWKEFFRGSPKNYSYQVWKLTIRVENIRHSPPNDKVVRNYIPLCSLKFLKPLHRTPTNIRGVLMWSRRVVLKLGQKVYSNDENVIICYLHDIIVCFHTIWSALLHVFCISYFTYASKTDSLQLYKLSNFVWNKNMIEYNMS